MKAVVVQADPFLFVSSALISPLLFLASNSVQHTSTLVSCLPCVQEVYMPNLAFASYENVLLWNWFSEHADAVVRGHPCVRKVYGSNTTWNTKHPDWGLVILFGPFRHMRIT